jgi:dihydrodipicolinate synthase/N-acetylneuraminate lyase
MELAELRKRLLEGLFIPAHPLALSQQRRLDERRQRALTRYYLSAGCGGIAVGVHTTQFEIHDPSVGLYQPVLEVAAQEIAKRPNAPIVKVAGLVGKTRQAVAEAVVARNLGYDCGLLSLAAMREATDKELLAHCQRVAKEIPVMGFYLQPAVGGRVLSYEFWRRFVEIEPVVAIKIAPFNRYQTLEVVRAVAESGRSDEIALYTGNDDNILMDLVTPFECPPGAPCRTLKFVGGLLGQWAVWTHQAVALFKRARQLAEDSGGIPMELLSLNAALTDANGAIFDQRGGFAGCIPGIHEVLRRQGLMEATVCLDPNLSLSPGQLEEIDRIYSAYPYLRDDEFVADHLEEWLDA